MSVSYIVPVWRQETYERVSRPWLQRQVDEYGAELIEVKNAQSIFHAQEAGRLKAKHRYIMYVHDDVQLITPHDLTNHIPLAFERFPKLGMLGPVGKIEKARVPWWLNAGPYVGHYCRRGNSQQLIYVQSRDTVGTTYCDVSGDPALHMPRWDKFAKAGLVDGFYLIEDRERMNVPWDIETYGQQWHGYDVDRCYQAHQMGLDVMVSPWLFLHDNAGHAGYKGTDTKQINGRDYARRKIKSAGDALWLADLDVTNKLVRKKWGVN